MHGYISDPKDLLYVFGPEIRPMPQGYWITANHTDKGRNPIGLALAQDKLIQGGDHGPIFGVYKDGKPAILDAWDVPMLAQLRIALSGTQRLLRGGSLDGDLPPGQSQPRSAVGIRGDKVIHVYLDRASVRGLALVMRSLGCSDALQLSFSDRTTLQENDKLVAGSHPVVALLGSDKFEKLESPLVVVDPGHGGADPGAKGLLPHPEAFYNTQIAVRAASYLRDYHCTVLLTRYKDSETVSLTDRVEMANSAGADLFFSFHNNAAGGRGFESFINNPASTAETQLQMFVHQQIKDKVLNRFGQVDRGQKRADFYVLRKTKMEAVLIEGAFVDHQEDHKFLLNLDYLQALAVASALGVVQYLRLEKRPQAPAPPVVKQYTVEIEAPNLEIAEGIARTLQRQGYDAKVTMK